MNNRKGSLNDSNRICDVSAYCKGYKEKKGAGKKETRASIAPGDTIFQRNFKKTERAKKNYNWEVSTSQERHTSILSFPS